MSKRKQPESYRELIELLAHFIRHDEPETDEELDERIRAMGYEPSNLAAQMRTRINQAIDKSPLNWRNRTSQIEEERAKLAQFAVEATLTIEQIKLEIQQRVRGLGGEVALHFRKADLDKHSRSDLERLLMELRFQSSQQDKTSDDDE